jgi:ribosome-binding factor A
MTTGPNPNRSPRKNSILAAELREQIQAIITRGLADPRIKGMITVTEINVAQDGRTASVLVSVMPHDKESLTLHGLTAAAPHIRRHVGDVITNKHIPELHFKLDERTKKQAVVLEAIAKAREEAAELEAHNAVEAVPDPNASPASDPTAETPAQPKPKRFLKRH